MKFLVTLSRGSIAILQHKAKKEIKKKKTIHLKISYVYTRGDQALWADNRVAHLINYEHRTHMNRVSCTNQIKDIKC